MVNVNGVLCFLVLLDVIFLLSNDNCSYCIYICITNAFMVLNDIPVGWNHALFYSSFPPFLLVVRAFLLLNYFLLYYIWWSISRTNKHCFYPICTFEAMNCHGIVSWVTIGFVFLYSISFALFVLYMCTYCSGMYTLKNSTYLGIKYVSGGSGGVNCLSININETCNCKLTLKPSTGHSSVENHWSKRFSFSRLTQFPIRMLYRK